MVGGIVKEVVQLPDATWVDCQGTGSECHETRAIYIQRSEGIELGDKFWWQSGNAYWTPKLGNFSEFPIPRIGFSGVNRPTEEQIANGLRLRKKGSDE